MPLPVPPPGLIALGHTLTLVRYETNQLGAVEIRGPATGWRYRVRGFNPCIWVAAPDLPRFRALADFDVCEETRTNEPPDPLEPMWAELTALRSALEERERRGPPASKVASRGRPRATSSTLLAEMNHLNRHTARPWTYAELAVEFLEGARSKRPHDAVRKRLERFRERHPHMASEDSCPSCAAGDLGRPPPDAFDPAR